VSGSGKRNNLPRKCGSRSRGKERQLSTLLIPDGGQLIAQLKPAAAWARPFDDPILRSGGREVLTLRDAAAYIMKLPKAEQHLEEWQAATEALMMAAEDRGPLMHARIGMLRALNRNVERAFDQSRKDKHCLSVAKGTQRVTGKRGN
jgi:hypothetical protein